MMAERKFRWGEFRVQGIQHHTRRPEYRTHAIYWMLTWPLDRKRCGGLPDSELIRCPICRTWSPVTLTWDDLYFLSVYRIGSFDAGKIKDERGKGCASLETSFCLLGRKMTACNKLHTSSINVTERQHSGALLATSKLVSNFLHLCLSKMISDSTEVVVYSRSVQYFRIFISAPHLFGD